MYSVSLMMTAADLSAVCKGWDMQRHSVTLIYDEFYRQGDIEKQLGLVPLKMMDRSNIHDVPTDQVTLTLRKHVFRLCVDSVIAAEQRHRISVLLFVADCLHQVRVRTMLPNPG